ncbi:MAG TPA: V-type ATP synthase subunit B, partial [Planctomycetota bacterium]|nr:V-type ATP synthase subunit B [Planctomycetota bacterium]
MPASRLLTVEHAGVARIAGPLVFVERTRGVGLGEMVDIVGAAGAERRGQVLEVDRDRAIVQVLQGTHGLGLGDTRVRFSAEVARLGVGRDLLGRALDGSGRPIDGEPAPVPEAFLDVNGLPLNPAARDHPSEFIETGISAIDGLNTLVRGQKLPIFSAAGLPANELAAQIAAQARVASREQPAGGDAARSDGHPARPERSRSAAKPATAESKGAKGANDFVVVFGAMGLTHREASFFRARFAETGALEHTVLFLNLADDPAIERLLTPRAALTAAEFLAFERGMHVLVMLTDMTAYCEALRQVATAREEVPGRRGYPGYMYTDLATIYERAGRIRGRPGSITQLVILTMPDDDITHPIPDLTGYITEGQIVLSRELHRRGVRPPIDILPCLSRLMNAGIGAGRTVPEHRAWADQLYACYARGCEARLTASIVGEAALSPEDRRHLEFADDLEKRFLDQGERRRTIEETLDLAWRLLDRYPAAELKRLKPAIV